MGSLILFGVGGMLLILAAICGVSLFTSVSSDNSLTVFLIALGCGVMGVIVIAFGAILRGRTRGRQYTRNADWQETGGYTPNVAQSGTINDLNYHFVYHPPKQVGKTTHPPKLTVEVAVPTDEEFEIVREGWFDRFCKQLGIAREIQTGDRAFDDTFYLRTDSPAFVQTLLADPGRRAAALGIMNAGFSDVTLQNRKLVATWTGFHPWRGDPGTLVPDIAEKLYVLRDNLPPGRAASERSRSGKPLIRLGILWGVVVFLFATLLSFVAYEPMRSSDIFFKSLIFSVPGWFVFAWLSAMLLRGTSRSHYRWATLISVGAFAFLFGGVGATNLVNGAFDSSPRVTRVETISDKTTSRSRRSTTYSVKFPSARHPGQTDSIKVSSSVWNTIVPHRSQVEMVTSSGSLGVELLRSKQIHAQPK